MVGEHLILRNANELDIDFVFHCSNEISVRENSLNNNLIHYPEHINNLSNLIMLSGFQEKLIGGIFLGYLYNYRGFGITCICHITFNFLIYINVIGNPS